VVRPLLDQLDQRGADAGRVNTRQHLAWSGMWRGDFADLQVLEPGPIENQSAHLAGNSKLCVLICQSIDLNEMICSGNFFLWLCHLNG
jgi:hypothetical protein